jgi:hypothetical protein
MTALKVQRDGERLTIEAPREAMDRLSAALGPEAFLHDLGEGKYLLSSAADEVSLQRRLGEGVMADFDAAFVELAR